MILWSAIALATISFIFLLFFSKSFKTNSSVSDFINELGFKRVQYIGNFFKWIVVSIVIYLTVFQVSESLKEREVEVNEMKQFDIYTSQIISLDSSTQVAYARYFSIITPNEKLRERWKEYLKYLQDSTKRKSPADKVQLPPLQSTEKNYSNNNRPSTLDDQNVLLRIIPDVIKRTAYNNFYNSDSAHSMLIFDSVLSELKSQNKNSILDENLLLKSAWTSAINVVQNARNSIKIYYPKRIIGPGETKEFRWQSFLQGDDAIMNLDDVLHSCFDPVKRAIDPTWSPYWQ
ncbi:MAG TPA: hypothetical protein VHB70_08215 [Parafilimonas sp.]|nr:hypothetical protein [Parafilimonas sp.]